MSAAGSLGSVGRVSSIRRWVRDPRALALVVAVLLFALMACGSTVQDRSQLAQRQGNVPVDEFGNPIPGAPGTGGTFVPGQPGSTIGGGPGGFVPGPGGSITSSGNGPGVTSQSIKIGDVYCDDQDRAANALGFNPAPSDQKRAMEIVVEDTNKHGGIGGRKVEVVWYNFEDCTAVSQSPSQLYEAACQHFTRDNKVFAVMGSEENQPNYIACVLRAGAVIIHNNIGDYDKQFQRQYPYFIQPSNLAGDSIARLQVPALKARGYFNTIDPVTFPTLKIGIVVEDTPGFVRVLNGALLPALREAGYSVSDSNIARIQPLARLQDAGALSAAISAAVLRFNANKVSHVLFLQSNGNMTLFFLREAESQDYYPRYGFNTMDNPQGVLDYSGGGVVSARNYNNSIGIGWDPLGDVPRGAGPTTPERTACINLLKRNGYDNFGDANAERIALGVCNGISFLKLSVGRAGSVINQSTFLAAVNGIGGSRWRAGDALGYSLFLPTKHDGVNQYRMFEFNEQRQVFEYTSSNITIGF